MGLGSSAALSGCASPARDSELRNSDDWRRQEVDRMYAGYDTLSDVATIQAEELVDRLASDDLVVVDVRTEPERAVSMIPGAITQEEFEARQETLRDATVVTYCTIGYRSGLYAQELAAEGFEVLNLEGSLLSWTHAGGALEVDGVPTRQLHVYGKKWDLAATAYEAQW